MVPPPSGVRDGSTDRTGAGMTDDGATVAAGRGESAVRLTASVDPLLRGVPVDARAGVFSTA